jgi:hypothetical protein
VFKEFAERTEAISLPEPGTTTALEFSDGKIMLGMATSLEAITYERILETVGQDRFRNLVGESDIVALVDWTMVSGMTDILTSVLERVLPKLREAAAPKFFFDLADPAKRSPGNADLSDEAAGVSNDGAKSENADIAASAGNGKRRTLSYLHRLAGRYLMY